MTLRAVPHMEVRDISKRFETEAGSIEALHQVSLSVMPGEFLCIVGPSGCGKSTLLNLMAGLEAPTLGHVSCGDRKVTGPGPERVVVFQEGGLFPWLNTIENVEFGLKIRGTPKDQRREMARSALKLVNLSRFELSYPHQLSGGMKQRAAIARALVLNPEILLMDEPFSALDAQTRETLYDELHDIWKVTRKTIVFVTHNVREAACLGDRIVLMSAHPGQIHKEYRIELPRPRAVEDAGVRELARAVITDLMQLSPAATRSAKEEAQTREAI
jgi:NitT/TauT family transport system ATP-binding protein